MVQRSFARYEDYREAWQLLREASEVGEPEEGVEEVTEPEPAKVAPSSALGRMEAAGNYFRRYLERSNVVPGKVGGER
jgi:hypothetical protein